MIMKFICNIWNLIEFVQNQADTFKNWINVNLKEVGFSVDNLETDFQVKTFFKLKQILFHFNFSNKIMLP